MSPSGKFVDNIERAGCERPLTPLCTALIQGDWQFTGQHRQGLALAFNNADISWWSTDQNSEAVSDIPGHFLTCPSLFFSPSGNSRVSATVGNSSVLVCSLKSNTILVTWKIRPKTGGSCTLGYRADQNKTDRTNCSDSVNWKFRPDRDPALEIQQVGIVHEGNYTCEVVATEGNFHKTYHLTVLGKGRLPHFTVLQRTASGPGHAKLLSPYTGGSMQ